MTMNEPIYRSPNPHRLYRNPDRGMVAGVCAGLADYFGIKDWQVRGLAVLALLVFTPQTLLAYLVLAVVLKRRPPHLYRDTEEEAFWRSVSNQPDQTFSGLRYKFRDLEQRLISMESHVTSEEFKLRREFRNLE